MYITLILKFRKMYKEWAVLGYKTVTQSKWLLNPFLSCNSSAESYCPISCCFSLFAGHIHIFSPPLPQPSSFQTHWPMLRHILLLLPPLIHLVTVLDVLSSSVELLEISALMR